MVSHITVKGKTISIKPANNAMKPMLKNNTSTMGRISNVTMVFLINLFTNINVAFTVRFHLRRVFGEIRELNLFMSKLLSIVFDGVTVSGIVYEFADYECVNNIAHTIRGIQAKAGTDDRPIITKNIVPDK